MFLEHVHSVCCLSCVHTAMAELSSSDRDIWPAKSELFTQVCWSLGYQINVQKLTLFLCTSNKQLETGILKITIYNSFKNMKFVEINLTKYVKNLYIENYKILLRKVKDDLNKWRGISVHVIKDLLLSLKRQFSNWSIDSM